MSTGASPLGIEIEGMTRIKLGNGEIAYLESCVPDHDLWLSRLMNEVPWSPERVMLYGKERVLRRQTCNYGDDYDYNKLAKPAIPLAGPVLELTMMLNERTGRVFTQVALNLYPDGETGIGLHHDKRHPLTVAAISFGAERIMGFAPKGGKKVDTSLPTIKLASGSLLLFTDAVNENFKHTIIEDKSVRGPRSALNTSLPADPRKGHPLQDYIQWRCGHCSRANRKTRGDCICRIRQLPRRLCCCLSRGFRIAIEGFGGETGSVFL